MYQATLRTGARRVLMALLIAAALACALIALPSSAQALEVTATTARSNSDNDNSIYGGMETRVTWEAQTASDESLSTLTLDYPDGSTIPANQVKVTGLSGLNRITLDYTVASVDADTVAISFNTPTQAGLLIRVEASKAVLPAEGGSLSVSGSATLANGAQVDIPNGPAMNVVGVSVAQQLSNKLSEQGWVQAWNQNRLLHMFFDPTIIVISIPAVFHGWLLALLMVVCSFPIAIVIGLLLCFLRISHVGILRFLGSLYVNIVRGTPLFLQIYIAFFGLPLLGINIDNYLLSVIVMSLNSGAYLCEIFRAGIESISKGQFEAARSLGMNAVQTAGLQARHPHHDERVHPPLQGHLAVCRSGRDGDGHVCPFHHRHHRQHDPLHRGSPLLPAGHPAADQVHQHLREAPGRPQPWAQARRIDPLPCPPHGRGDHPARVCAQGRLRACDRNQLPARHPGLEGGPA